MKYLRKFDSVAEMQAAIQADKVSFLGLAQPQGQEPTMNIHVHVPVYPTNLVISCSNNTVTITATNATTIEYKLTSSGEYTTYTTPFAITETVTVYAKASTSDGSITDSQQCVYADPKYSEPFYIENISGKSITVQITKQNNNSPTLYIDKSTDGTNWSSMGNTSTTAITATVSANSKLYLRCATSSWCSGEFYNKITTTGNCNVGGNIMSLLYGSSFNGQKEFKSDSVRAFGSIFYGNTYLISAANLLLPATTLVNYCYQGMFYGCSGLTTAPVLQATTLVKSCYQVMFWGCSSLTTAPVLPATTLASECYKQMFQGCTSLNYIKCLATDISASSCTYNWVFSITTTGTFVKDANMSTWTTGNNGIPSNWTVQDAQD